MEWNYCKNNINFIFLYEYILGPRPASLVITKNEGNSQFKLVRSSSIDYDDIESQQHTTTIQRPINRTTLLEQLQEDESAPLVFTVHK